MRVGSIGKFVGLERFTLTEGLGEKHRPPTEAFAASHATNAKFKLIIRFRLWASACHSNTARALAKPRTLNWRKPRLRKCALVHSMLAARSL